ncbi:hypothetical protein [Kineosporia sp. R_H_3]|uniref:hypothetical protein n=1 Tax=Kineosporia sp. R_H_3 TaxID=1961848 RepID=UPI000B4B0E50|nr:hypothetical protein [Kineosporia sp. R_H_3]
MAEKWRRCLKCRSIKPVEDFDGDEETCRACLTAPVRKPRASASTVTTRRVSVDADAPGPAAGSAPSTAAAAVTPAVRNIAPRDVRGRGDHEVRARRARVRALDRLAEEYPEDFARILGEERSSEGLT